MIRHLPLDCDFVRLILFCMTLIQKFLKMIMLQTFM